jgi:hypothetical protein
VGACFGVKFHPHILRREGDKYREYLQKSESKQNVIFRNRFVSPQEMMELIGAADIYITRTNIRHKWYGYAGLLR